MTIPPNQQHLVVNAVSLQRYFNECGWSFHARTYLSEAPQRGRVIQCDLGCSRPIETFVLTPLVLLNPAALMVTPNGKLLRESMFYPEVSITLQHNLPLLVPQFSGPVLPLNSLWFGEFWHWIHEYLPRIVIAEKANFTGQYLIDPQAPPFVRESLSLMGLDSSRLQVASAGAWYHEEVWVPEILRASYELKDVGELLLLVRNRILDAVKSRSDENASFVTKPRIYVSRRGARKRRVTNEPNLERILTQYGFETVALEELTFTQQVSLFSRAEAVVAAHGAGLAHSLFLPSGATVIELFSPHFIHPNSPTSYRLLNIKHSSVVGRPEKHPAPATPQEANHQNIEIEASDLEDALKAAF